MLFHGTKIIPLDSRWHELADGLGFSCYQDIIACETNLICRNGLTHVHHLKLNDQIWPEGIYLKKIIPDRWTRFFLRPAKSHLEARNYRLMEHLNVPIPQVLAIGERRTLGGLIDAFIITEGVPDTITLEQYAEKHSGKPPAEEFQAIFEQLVDIVRRMHRENIYHVDLQWRNVLVQKDTIKLFLIDSPRGGKRWLPLRKWNGRMHDLAGLEKLARLYLSPKERLDWFKRYTGRTLTRQDKRLIQSVLRELEHRRRRREGKRS